MRAGGRDADLLLDADPGQTLAELLPPLLARVRGAQGAEVHPAFAARTPLWVDGASVDAARTLREAGVRPGSVLSLDPPDRPAAPPTGVAELRVVGGHGAGRVHRLPLGTTLVGCGATGLSLPDLQLPADALAVTVAPDGVVRVREVPGLGAVLADEPLERAPAEVEPAPRRGRRRRRRAAAAEAAAAADPPAGRAWPSGAHLRAGSTVLQLVTGGDADEPPADARPARDHPGLDLGRPPRLLPPVRERVFTLPRPPGERVKRPLPWVMVLAPALMVVPMALILGNPRWLFFAILSPLMALANWASDRRGARKRYLDDVARFERETAEVEERVAAAQALEVADRRRRSPDAAALLLTALGPGRRLWERRRPDPDALVLRLGLADVPGEVVVREPGFLTSDEPPAPREVRGVPVEIDVRAAGVVGVAGADGLAAAVGRWLVGQAAVLHSPRDLSVVLLTGADGRSDWEWLRWLPHARASGAAGGGAAADEGPVQLGHDASTVGARLAELGRLVEARAASRPRHGAWTPPGPDVLVVLDGARRLRALPGVVGLLRDGPGVGVHVLCLEDEVRTLPEECRAVVVVREDALSLSRPRADPVDGALPDLVDDGWAPRVARALAPLRDTTPDVEESGVPASARLLDCLGLDRPDGADVLARWRREGRTTRAVLGVGYDGVAAVDLRRDGPHALVAGTTGAGKSELLQTLVASLALANRPDALAFVLVDYKGGSAFAACSRLPHVVGMVTDLDEHLVSRALASLTAELRRREHVLGAAGAKDLEDYWRLADRDPAMVAVPRLVLVIDEFASLVAELPDFVKGLVSVAQRGRSLGIHLVLATQRPSGVVSGEIRANTNLRICLRVTDEVESRDVVDAPDAAHISAATPGRAYVRTGSSSLLPVQAGRVGGRRPGSSGPAVPLEPLVSPLPWEALGGPLPRRPAATGPEVEEDATDLADVVAAVGDAARRLGAPAVPSPWLPALPEVVATDALRDAGAGVEDPDATTPLDPVALEGLDGDADAAAAAGPEGAGWALEDHPGRQAQRVRRFALGGSGHLYVVGGARTGRTTALRTLVAGLVEQTGAGDLHVHALDCGSGGLLPLADLPHAGAVVQRTQTERVERLLRRLVGEVARRQEVLAAGGYADVREQRAAVDAGLDDGPRLPYVLLVLDRWEGFLPVLGEMDGGRLAEEVQQLLREGASAGLHLLVSGDRSLLSGRMGALVEHKLVLRLPDRSDYVLAGLRTSQVPTALPPGRGIWSDTAVEAQVAVLPGPTDGAGQADAVRGLARRLAEREADVPASARAPRLEALPARLHLDAALAGAGPLEARPPLWVPLGVGGDDLDLLGVDLSSSPVAVVAGPPRSGRTAVLRAAAAVAGRRGLGLLALAPRGGGDLVDDVRRLGGAALSGGEVPLEALVEALRAVPGPGLVLVDDAEALREGPLAPALAALVRQARDRSLGVLVAGAAAELSTGLTGWVVEARRSRQGLLLSPTTLVDGDAVGARLQRSQLAPRVQPGRGLLAAGGGLVPVQAPWVEPSPATADR
ncbi:FtsK/SpoIIIE domain-containing protein [Pseudokineococcus marinus]|uniref:FtsK/SpoIIIE domain-containing protein n=1 Tax=Pseudokineococcus marinus TaxID=351215 RepID=UPI0031D192FC